MITINNQPVKLTVIPCPPRLAVATEPPASGASVSASCGDRSVSAVTDQDGKCEIDLPVFGIWEVTGQGHTAQVDVSDVRLYSVTLGGG